MSYKQIIATMCNTATHIRCYKNTKEKKKKKNTKERHFNSEYMKVVTICEDFYIAN